MAGETVLSQEEKDALLERLSPTELEGGGFPSPEQRAAELASILRELITAVTVT